LQTANDDRPRPEIIIGNAKVNKIGRHARTHKTLQREATIDGKGIKGGCFDKSKHFLSARVLVGDT